MIILPVHRGAAQYNQAVALIDEVVNDAQFEICEQYYTAE